MGVRTRLEQEIGELARERARLVEAHESRVRAIDLRMEAYRSLLQRIDAGEKADTMIDILETAGLLRLGRVASAAALAILLVCGVAQAQVIDHASVAGYDTLDPAIAQTRLLIVNRSVGAIINDGLTCLSTPYAAARTACKRWVHPAGSQYHAQPEPWTLVLPRATVTFLGHSGITPALPCNPGEAPLACFVRYVDTHHADYDAVLFVPSYLLETDAATYLSEMDALQARHPALRVLLSTASVSRAADASHTAFNAAVRAGATLPLLDVADIESHDQSGASACDNRDGVPYVFGVKSENYPDDGACHEAISVRYTPEVDGGHPGNPDVGKIRLAKAVWVLVAGL